MSNPFYSTLHSFFFPAIIRALLSLNLLIRLSRFWRLISHTMHFLLALDVTGCCSALRKMCTHTRLYTYEPRMSDGYHYRFRVASSRVHYSISIRREDIGVALAFEIADDVCAYNKYRGHMCNQIAASDLSCSNLLWHFFFVIRIESGYQHE